MKHSMTVRAISLLLCLVMSVTLLPLGGRAAEPEETDLTEEIGETLPDPPDEMQQPEEEKPAEELLPEEEPSEEESLPEEGPLEEEPLLEEEPSEEDLLPEEEPLEEEPLLEEEPSEEDLLPEEEPLEEEPLLEEEPSEKDSLPEEEPLEEEPLLEEEPSEEDPLPEEEPAEEEPFPEEEPAEEEPFSVEEPAEEEPLPEEEPAKEEPLPEETEEDEEAEEEEKEEETPSEETQVFCTVGEGGGLLTLSDGSAAALLSVTAEGNLVKDVILALHRTYLTEEDCAFSGEGAVTRFWGRETGGIVCHVNGEEAVPDSPVEQGDRVEFCFPGSGSYSFFQTTEITVREKESFSLTLMQRGSSGISPCSSAALLLNGKSCGVSTDADGVATLTIDAPGSCVVSANKVVMRAGRPIQTITPPVCVVRVLPEKSSLSSLRIARTSSFVDGELYLAMPEDGSDAPKFAKDVLSYDLGEVSDAVASLYFSAVPGKEGDKIFLEYDDVSRNITPGSTGYKSVRFLHGGVNRFTIHAGTLESAVYDFTLRAVPSLLSVSVMVGERELLLDREFDPTVSEYTLTLPVGTESVSISAQPRDEAYTVSCSGGSLENADVTDADALTLAVTSADGACSRSYTLTLMREKESLFRIIPKPADSLVRVTDRNGNALTPDEDGYFHGIFTGGKYSYTVTHYGYVTKKGAVPDAGGEKKVTLKKVEDDSPEDVDAEWRNFRNSDSNMAITTVELPTEEEADSVALKWQRRLGEDWNSSPSVQIIVDHALVTMSGTKIYKLDLESGETLAYGDMADTPNWGYTPPAYVEGKIFCPLNNGTIQAFDAKTLRSLWIYRDPLGGQSLSPITCADGYLYTGFWNGETKDARYVCLSITDEDQYSEMEAKEAVWALKHTGGFYWAGSVVVGNAVIVGGEDGVNGGGDSTLYSLDRRTGRIISAVTLPGMGDQRSSIAWESGEGRVYFTVQDGYFCSLAVNTATGVLSDLRSSGFEGQSTSTPVVYKGRAYYGVGSGITESGSSGAVVVADASTMKELYRIELRGYPQGSLLLSTARESEGWLYFYATYNNKPGGISMIRVSASGQTAEGAEVIELFNAEGAEEYCISSLICSADGTLYYKNDSGNIFAVGIPYSENVIALIDAIGENITADSESAVTAARAAYNALSDAEKARVTNLGVLERAERLLAEIMERIRNVEALIDAIGTVDGTEETRQRVKNARAACDALSETERAHVSNAAVLSAAERKQQKYDNAHRVEALIDAIGTVTNESECEQRITEARNAFDALLGTEKALVGNYGTLTEAERQLRKLKEDNGGENPEDGGKDPDPGTDPEGGKDPDPTPGGTTRILDPGTGGGGSDKVAVTIHGMIYTVERAPAELMKTIEKLYGMGEEAHAEDWIEAYKTYAAMSDAHKAQIFNYDDLEAGVKRLGAAFHRSEALNAETEDLPWHVKMELLPVSDNRVAEMGRMVEQLGGRMLRLYQLSFTDVLTEEEYVPTAAVRIRMDAPEGVDWSQYPALLLAARDADGRVNCLDCDREDGALYWCAEKGGLYALSGGQAEAETELPEEEPPETVPETVEEPEREERAFPAALALTFGFGFAVLVAALVLKRLKMTKE